MDKKVKIIQDLLPKLTAIQTSHVLSVWSDCERYGLSLDQVILLCENYIALNERRKQWKS